MEIVFLSYFNSVKIKWGQKGNNNKKKDMKKFGYIKYYLYLCNVETKNKFGFRG